MAEGAQIRFTLDDKAFTAALERAGGVMRTGWVRAIGAGLVEVTQARFESESEPLGGKWQALNPAYAMIKRGPGILRASLVLQRYITFATAGNQVTVGSNRIYAAVHQFGATIRPKNARALVFRLGRAGPRGGKSSGLVHAKSVTIPARPYLGFGPKDQREVLEVTATEINRALGM